LKVRSRGGDLIAAGGSRAVSATRPPPHTASPCHAQSPCSPAQGRRQPQARPSPSLTGSRESGAVRSLDSNGWTAREERQVGRQEPSSFVLGLVTDVLVLAAPLRSFPSIRSSFFDQTVALALAGSVLGSAWFRGLLSGHLSPSLNRPVDVWRQRMEILIVNFAINSAGSDGPARNRSKRPPSAACRRFVLTALTSLRCPCPCFRHGAGAATGSIATVVFSGRCGHGKLTRFVCRWVYLEMIITGRQEM